MMTLDDKPSSVWCISQNMQNCWVGIHFYEKQWEEQNHVSATSSSFRIITIKTSPCVLTHLIQFLHISDDLSWVLHFQHCCPYHHSLFLVLHLSVTSTMLLHMSFIKDHIEWQLCFDTKSTFFNSLFLASFPARNMEIWLAFWHSMGIEHF